MVIYRDRAYNGLPAPHNNNGTTLRPLLAQLRPTITCHYPGSPIGRSYAGDAMLGDVKKKTYLHNMQRYAQSAGKSFEYNYLIFMDGEVWEYAGDYLAAHSAGDNADSIGVQFVNGQDDPCTGEQIQAFRWLRDIHLKSRKRLTIDCATTPHREMPGAATSCPGDRAIMPYLPQLRLPHNPAPPPPVPVPVPPPLPVPPPVPGGKGVPVQFVIKAVSGTSVYITDWLTKRHIDGPTYDLFRLISQDPANGIRMEAGPNGQQFFTLADVIVEQIPAGVPIVVAGPSVAQIADEFSRRLVS